MRRIASSAVVLATLVALAVAAVSLASTEGVASSPSEKIAALKRQVAAQRLQIRKLEATVERLRGTLASQSPTGVTKQLALVKAANDKYQSVEAAKADGYVAASPCESSPQGAMGIHFVKGPAMADAIVDPMSPEILTYQPSPNGPPRLLAAEYFKADADQDLSTDSDRPTLFGRQFDGPMLGHGPGMPKHYDMHVWLWKHNPSGTFAQWNPDVSCPIG